MISYMMSYIIRCDLTFVQVFSEKILGNLQEFEGGMVHGEMDSTRDFHRNFNLDNRR